MALHDLADQITRTRADRRAAERIAAPAMQQAADRGPGSSAGEGIATAGFAAAEGQRGDEGKANERGAFVNDRK